MSQKQIELLDQKTELRVAELCRICDVSREVIIQWVEEGVVEPCSREEWRFSGAQLGRLRRARRLQRDLELEANALPIVLDLLEEVERLRREVKVLRRFRD